MSDEEEDVDDIGPGYCDCCTLCVSPACCHNPEYCCPGHCGHRGEPGHYGIEVPDANHPTLSFPERR